MSGTSSRTNKKFFSQYYWSITICLLLLAWIGNTVNNLLLIYLAGEKCWIKIWGSLNSPEDIIQLKACFFFQSTVFFLRRGSITNAEARTLWCIPSIACYAANYRNEFASHSHSFYKYITSFSLGFESLVTPQIHYIHPIHRINFFQLFFLPRIKNNMYLWLTVVSSPLMFKHLMYLSWSHITWKII